MIQRRTVVGYDGIERVLKEAEGEAEGIWIGSASGRWVHVVVNRGVFVNVGLAKHEFHSFSEAINYITEFLFN